MKRPSWFAAAASVMLIASFAQAVQAKTDAAKAAERAAKEQKKAAEMARRDSIETAKTLAKPAQNEPAQVLIPGATMMQVHAALNRVMVDNGLRPVDVNDYMAVYDKPASRVKSAIAGAIVGTPYGSNATAKHRVTFTIDEDAEGIRVVNTSVDLIVNEGLRTEFHDDQTKKSREAMRGILSSVGSYAMKGAARGQGSPTPREIRPGEVAPADSIVPDSTKR